MIHYSIIPNADGFLDCINQIFERNIYSIYLDLDNQQVVVKDSTDTPVTSASCDMSINGLKAVYQGFIDSSYINVSI